MEKTIINRSGSYTFIGDAVSCCRCYVMRYVAYKGALTIYERKRRLILDKKRSPKED